MKDILNIAWERLTLPLPEFQEKYAPWTIEHEHDMSKPFTVSLQFSSSHQDSPVFVKIDNVIEYKLYVTVNPKQNPENTYTQHIFVTTDSVIQYQECDEHKLIMIKETHGQSNPVEEPIDE